MIRMFLYRFATLVWVAIFVAIVIVAVAALVLVHVMFLTWRLRRPGPPGR